MSASIALQPGALEHYETPSTSEPAWIKVTLITVALTFYVIFLLFPLGTVFVQALSKGWGVYLSALTSHDALAAIKLTLITAAIAVPLIATLAFTIFFGWVLLISGGVGLVSTFSLRPAPGFWWSLLSAILAIAVGFLLIAKPGNGAVSLIAIFVIGAEIVLLSFGVEAKRFAMKYSKFKML